VGPRAFSSYIVSPPDLDAAIKSSPSGNKIIPVCADWYLPNASQKGTEEYIKLRIPNARFFDVDLVKDLLSPYPHMLPTGETFAKALSEQGINRDDTIVIYDSAHNGIFSGPRVAWTFKVFGHEKVHLLDNFKLWVEQGYPTESGVVKSGVWERTDYPVVEPDKSIIVDFEEVVKHAEHAGGGVEILDARPKGRFLGVDPEPREGLALHVGVGQNAERV
jgi:thiosulfate/3-mercaptopyruvate sulfurtransferase